jgi:hypothetical protein
MYNKVYGRHRHSCQPVNILILTILTHIFVVDLFDKIDLKAAVVNVVGHGTWPWIWTLQKLCCRHV